MSQEKLVEESVIMIFMSKFGKRILQSAIRFQSTFSMVPAPVGQLYNVFGTNHSTYSVIHGFMKKESLAHSKFQYDVAETATKQNPSKKDRRLEKLKMSLQI